MKCMALILGVIAFGLAATAPARADYAVVQWNDGYCHIWWDASGTPWGTDWTKIAITPDWDSAVRAQEVAEGTGRCR